MTGWQGTSVLVAGGCGYVGGHLVRRLVKAGAKVRVVDDLSRGSVAALADAREKVEFIQADLRRPDVAAKACDGIACALNLAANASGIRYSIANQPQMFFDNASASINVLEAARKAGVKRYIYFSSSCVYPDNAPIPTPEEYGDTGTPESGNVGYGWAKRVGELQASLYRDRSPMSITCVRPVNIFGEGEHYDLEIGHVIPSLIMKAMAADRLKVMGSGRQTRAFVYVGDLADICMRIATDGGAIKAINVCSPEETSIGQLAHMVVKAIGRPDMPIDFDTSAPEGAPRKFADVKRLLEFLGGDYKFTSLQTGIQRMVDEYRAMVRK
jgi:nucleoside-diphosphate-sugar epimerase